MQEGVVSLTVQTDENLTVRERIFDAAVESGFKIVGLQTKVLSLEDIFVEITTREDDAPPATDKSGEKGAQK